MKSTDIVDLFIVYFLRAQGWDHSQRKVVRYDHSIGDRIEPKGGHGTKVGGAAAGSLYGDDDSEANGVAEGAKLHVFDIQQGSGKSHHLCTSSFSWHHFQN